MAEQKEMFVEPKPPKLTLEEKISEAIRFLKANEPQGEYIVAFSGGKDSIVLLSLVREAKVRHRVVYNVTTIDPPELVRFIRKNYPEAIFNRPKYTMRELIIKKGFPPTRHIRYCCDRLKERVRKKQHLVTGVRAEESFSRKNSLMIEPDHKTKSATHYRPILYWNEADIWNYIEMKRLEYCSLYDEDFSRLGCVMCPLAGEAQMKREAARWPNIYRMYLAAFQKGIEEKTKRGKKLTQKTGQEMMDWWLNGAGTSRTKRRK